LHADMACCNSAYWDRVTANSPSFASRTLAIANYSGASTCAEVQVHPSGKFVYGSNRGHDSIAVFGFDQASGKLKCLEHQPTQGKTPRHFALDPAGHWLLAENQDSDNIVVFRVDSKTGRLSPAGQTVSVGAPVCAVFLPLNLH